MGWGDWSWRSGSFLSLRFVANVHRHKKISSLFLLWDEIAVCSSMDNGDGPEGAMGVLSTFDSQGFFWSWSHCHSFVGPQPVASCSSPDQFTRLLQQSVITGLFGHKLSSVAEFAGKAKDMFDLVPWIQSSVNYWMPCHSCTVPHCGPRDFQYNSCAGHCD